MPLEGLDTVKANLRKLVERMHRQAAQAAAEIAELLESDAKAEAPFTDRTTNLRTSIDGTWAQVREDLFRVVLSAGMEYAAFVELLHQGRYAYLWPAIERNQDRIMQIWRKALAL